MQKVYNLSSSDLDQMVTSTIECEDMIASKQCSKEDCASCDKHKALEMMLEAAEARDILTLDTKMKHARWKKYHPTKVPHQSSGAGVIILTIILTIVSIAGTCLAIYFCSL